MAQYDEKDAAKDTNVSTKEVSSTWHQARDDAAKEGNWGVPKDRHGSSDSSSGSSGGSDSSNNSGK